MSDTHDGRAMKVRLWKHHKNDNYVPLCWFLQGEPGCYSNEVVWAGRIMASRGAAMAHGLKERGDDDFNIAVLRNGLVVAMLWDNEWVDYDDESLEAITKGLFG